MRLILQLQLQLEKRRLGQSLPSVVITMLLILMSISAARHSIDLNCIGCYRKQRKVEELPVKERRWGKTAFHSVAGVTLHRNIYVNDKRL